MAKAEFSRDFYADLELPPTADVNDVKKQFRKLGKAVLRCVLLLVKGADGRSKRSSITPIATRDGRRKSTPSFRRSNPPMKS